MKKIKIIKSRPLKEEEVVDQVPQDTAPETPELTYESNPLEFMLQKYPTLTKTLVELLTDDFRNYIVGVYIMAPKPTIFKIVLHNNRSFHLIFMGDDKYEAKVSGKKYWLASIDELERATIAIADLLMMGTPPSTQGPDTEMTASPEEEAPEAEETGGEEAGGEEEGAPEELAEGKLGIKLIKEDIVKDLKKLGYKDEDIVPLTKNKIKLLVPGKQRRSEFDKLVKAGYKRVPVKGTSMGGVETKDGTIIIPKPKEKQGGGSAGLGNESFLVNKINSTIDELDSTITVIFKSKGKTVKYNKVNKAEEAGRETSGNRKSDVRIYSGDKVIGNLSLKQENASMWESADKRYKELMQKLVIKLKSKSYKNLGLAKTDREGIYRLYNPLTKTEYGGIIITGLDKTELNSIVFGSDVPKTVVVKETFDESDFSLNGTTLTVTVNDLLTDVKDIEGTKYEPILVVRHDVTRTATGGLRPVVYNKDFAYDEEGTLKGNKIELPFNKI
jgi:hypothetical protein